MTQNHLYFCYKLGKIALYTTQFKGDGVNVDMTKINP